MLGAPSAWLAHADDLVTNSAPSGDPAFLRLQALMAQEVAADVGDETARAALWRLSLWLHIAPPAAAALVTAPPLERHSMASERRRR